MNQTAFNHLEAIIQRDYNNIAGILIQKDGLPCYEHYFNGCAPDDALHVFSVTKSIVSALIGIALQQGFIKSIDQPVLDFFPDHLVEPGNPTIGSITIRHLLTMTAPYKQSPEPYAAFFASPNWLEFALDQLGGTGPIGPFLYSPIVGAHILSGILVRATGQSVLDFATANLFAPLGIPVENVVLHSEEEQLAWSATVKKTRGWVMDAQGFNTASWGLTLRARDLAKIGQLYLNGGVWEGQPLVSPAWIAASIQEQSRWGELPYGYLWWNVGQHAFAAMGDGGNTLYVNKANGLVVSILSFYQPEVTDRLDFITEQIEPIFNN